MPLGGEPLPIRFDVTADGVRSFETRIDEADLSARVRVACTDPQRGWLQYLGLGAGTPVHVGQGILAAIIEPPPGTF